MVATRTSWCAVWLRAASVAAMSSASVVAQNPFAQPEDQSPKLQLWAEVGFGVGDLNFAPQDGSSPRDEEYLGLLRGRIEITPPPGLGLGLAGEVASFDGPVVVGPAPVRADVDGSLAEAFVYAVYTGRVDRLRCPFRLGLAFLDHTFDTGRKYEYQGSAFRIQAEPEFALFDDGSTRLSVYAMGSYSWGDGVYESALDDIREDLDLTQAGYEFGARLRLGPVWIGVGWANNQTEWRSDRIFTDLDLSFEGLVFSIGASN